jgi:hypothetical protein
LIAPNVVNAPPNKSFLPLNGRLAKLDGECEERRRKKTESM